MPQAPAATAPALRIATDVPALERGAPPGVRICAYSAEKYPSTWPRRWRLLKAALRSDHLVVEFTLSDVTFFAAALALLPFHRCRLTTLDFFVGSLSGLRLRVAQWSLSRVDRLLVYFKDSHVFEDMFGLPAAKFRYIPCKINSIELIRQMHPIAGDYVFCGGRSRRDFATLLRAIEPLGIPLKIVTSNEQEMNQNGSSLAGVAIPGNVEVFTHDRSAAFFVSTMAAARFVVIPIVPDTITQAGIAVYLQAMALGKCVIVSTGLGVSDVLQGDEAIIVPAGEVDALRTAIERVWNDTDLRDRFAQAGQRYALALGGEAEICRSILAALP